MIELLIATAVSLVIAGVVIEVLLTTARTTDQASSQSDVQARARYALRDWEKDLRDGYAVLRHYEVQSGAEAGTVYGTTAGDTERTIVAAVPSIDTNGAPCIWKGVPVVQDCIVWQAVKTGADPDAVWELTRHTFPEAFYMAASYFTLTRGDPNPFRSLIWAQTSSDSYTVPPMGRTAEAGDTAKTVFSGAKDVVLEFFGFPNDFPNAPVQDEALLAPVGTATEPPARYPQPSARPYVLDAGKNRMYRATVTDVFRIAISLTYEKTASTLRTGRAASADHSGEVTQSDTESITIRLRNKPTW